MKILQRYILRETISYFLICVIAFTGVLLTVRILKFTNLIVNKGVAVSDIALVFLSIIPTFLEIAVPMATLLGVMLAFARLSGDSELVVLRASGISLTQLLKPVLVFGTCTFLVALYISLVLRPWGYQTLKDTLYKIAQSKTTAGLDAGIFNELGKLTLYTEEIDHNSGRLVNTMIDDKRTEEERSIIFAKRGKIVSNTDTQSIIIELYEGEIHEETKSGYSITAFDSNFIKLLSEDLLDTEKSKRAKRLRQEPTSNLFEYSRKMKSILSLEKTEQESMTAPVFLEAISSDQWAKHLNKIQVELARRFAVPAASLLLCLVAMPLGVQPPRMQKTWGASLSLLLGLMTFGLYFGLLSVGTALGESGTIHPYVGTWLPNIIVSVIAVVFIKKMGSEQWQSIAHGIEMMLIFIRNHTIGKLKK